MKEIRYVTVLMKEPFNEGFGSKAYNYKSAIPCKVGDIVLCETQYGLALGQIYTCDTIPLEDIEDMSKYKEIVKVIDLSDYEERKKRKEQANKLKARMKKLVEEQKEIELFKMMAKNNPELGSLLKEYEELCD